MQHDVVIIGTGIAGTILGAILARHGFDVVMIEKGSHPRFAIGESTAPETSGWLKALATRFDVPELALLGTFPQTYRKVAPTCGVKRHFGFVHHDPGRPVDPTHSTQSVIPELPYGTECHFFRQDIDAYTLHVAIRYGATYRPGVGVTGIDIDKDGVRVETDRAGTLRARYLVDGAGHASLMAKKEGLRAPIDDLVTHSRALFTHMIDVRPFEDIMKRHGDDGMPRRWSQGTLHHIFEGGWMWVIPFDNHRRAVNPLCSVGLCLDPRVYPKPDGPAEDEFAAFLARYPSVEEQFRGARAARPWISTPRLQYRCERMSGERWAMLAHSYGFIDALFSRGLTNSFQMLHILAPRIMAALREDDYSPERFEPAERWARALIADNDALVGHSYQSFGDFDLWDAWNRVWSIGIVYGGFRIYSALFNAISSGDMRHLAALDEAPYPDSLAPALEPFQPLFKETTALIQQVAAGELPAKDAARRIMARVSASPITPPALKLGDPDVRFADFRLHAVGKMMAWGKKHPDPAVREAYFQYPLGPPMAAAWKRIKAGYYRP